MNTKTLITVAIALLGASVSALAAGEQQYGDRTTHFEAAGNGPSKTRAQVLAELAEAVRIGAISRSESNTFPSDAQLRSIRLAGLKALPMEAAAQALQEDMAQLAALMDAPKTRTQVIAETAEARRLGLISQSETDSFPTPAQLALVRLAGLKALPMTVAAR